MTESSRPWPTDGTGDGPSAGYTDDNWSDMFRRLFTQDRSTMGIILGADNECEVTGVTSPVQIDTGHAVVDGKVYDIDAATTIAVSTPSAGNSRIDLIVLRKYWSGQTVRAYRVAGTEAASPSAPSLTQTDGVEWQIPLAQVSINDGGSITVTDTRVYAWSPLSYLYWLLGADGLITAKGQILGAKAADSLGVLAAAGGDQRVLRSLASAAEGLEWHNPVRYASGMPFSFYYGIAAVVDNGVDYVPVIPAELAGWNLVSVRIRVAPSGAPSGGPVTAQLYNVTDAVNMLSTAITIDAGEESSDTAATPAVIDAAHDDVAEGDLLRWDLSTVNGAIGFMWEAGFQAP